MEDADLVAALEAAIARTEECDNRSQRTRCGFM
jgi:hypothetical protein